MPSLRSKFSRVLSLRLQSNATFYASLGPIPPDLDDLRLSIDLANTVAGLISWAFALARSNDASAEGLDNGQSLIYDATTSKVSSTPAWRLQAASSSLQHWDIDINALLEGVPTWLIIGCTTPVLATAPDALIQVSGRSLNNPDPFIPVEIPRPKKTQRPGTDSGGSADSTH